MLATGCPSGLRERSSQPNSQLSRRSRSSRPEAVNEEFSHLCEHTGKDCSRRSECAEGPGAGASKGSSDAGAEAWVKALEAGAHG